MSIKRQVWVATVGVFAVTGAMLSFAVTEQEQQIIDRIKPVGEVCIQGKSDCAAPVAAVASGPRSHHRWPQYRLRQRSDGMGDRDQEVVGQTRNRSRLGKSHQPS